MKMESFMSFMFLCLEIHSRKIMLLATAVVCCINVDALHGILLFLVVIGVLTKGPQLRSAIIKLTALCVSFLILSKMVFQTKLFPHTNKSHNCSTVRSYNEEGFSFEPNAAWFGFEAENLTVLRGYFTVLGLATLLRAIQMNQTMRREGSGFNPVDGAIIFPGVRRQDADYDLHGALKFLLNYGYHKFGLEICKITLAVLVTRRRDVFGLIYGICLLLTLVTPRGTIRRLWTVLALFIAFCVLYQYSVALGAFPTLCFEYPWPMDSDLRKWLFLPYHNRDLNTKLIIGDIVLLLLIQQQGAVFNIEKKRLKHPAGTNIPVYQHFNSPKYQNPVPDHTTYSRPGVDHLKTFTFTTLYWASLTVSFMAGSTRSDLLSLGYLVGAFIIIWQGAGLYLWHVRALTKWWNFFMLYAVVSMIFKSVLSGLGCLLRSGQDATGWSWLAGAITGSLCHSSGAIYWDLLAFSCFLFQKRFFQSHYFLHHVRDVKATMVLQSSGAALIEQLQHDRLEQEKEERRKTVNKIKADMAIIKAYNERVLSPNALEPLTHDHAIMQGDYFMFEDATQIYRSSDRSDKVAVRRRRTITFDEFLGTIKDHQDEESGKSENEMKDAETTSYSLGEEHLELPQVDRPSEKKKKPKRPVILYVLFIKEVVENVLLDLIPILNKLSHDFRFVAWAMANDKINLKEKGASWDGDNPSFDLPDMEDFDRAEKEDCKGQIVIRFLDGVWFVLMANSELLCYLAVFLHQLFVPSLLSLPLPLMVLLWGALTAGRPSPTFWTTVIAYTEVIMVMKALFQNDLFPWSWSTNHQSRNIFYPPAVIGIERHAFKFPDICLLVMLFIHRKKLMSFGLWTDRVQEVHVPVVRFIEDDGPEVRDSVSEHVSPIRQFFRHFREESMRLPVDVYTYSFLCEFLTFIIVFFGFSSFSAHAQEGGERFYLADNEVPTTYLITLILQFFVILVDRVLYLRRNIVGKLIFHITLVVLSHIWLFIVLPIVTYRAFVNLLLPQVWYSFKYFSFLLSAYQLRTGYPMRVQGHFLCKNYNYINYFSFKAIKMIPFFTPIRRILSWLCVKTSLNLSEWHLLASMNSVIFETKCQRRAAADYPSPRGEAQPNKSKGLSGGLLLALLLIIIWSPLILFAIFNSVAEPAPPTEAIFTLRINTFEELYMYHMKEDEISPLSKIEYQRFLALGKFDPAVRLFLDQYSYDDVSVFKLNPSSRSSWSISPGNLQEMITSIRQAGSFQLHFSWEFKRSEKGEDTDHFSGDYKTLLGNDTKQALLNALTNKQSVVRIKTNVPLYFEAKGGTAKSVIFNQEEGPFGYGRITLTLKSGEGNLWWEVADRCQGQAATLKRQQLPQQDCERVVVYVFSQKHVPGIFRFITAKGIIGIYASFVLLVWTIVRKSTTGLYLDVKFCNLPNVDSILQLSKDLNLARESGEFALEEDLFAKLLFLFRSPETMIKWTRFREDELRPPENAIQEHN